MAFRKVCDGCGADVGTDGKPFVQIHGTVSEQVESVGGEVMYKYLTPYANAKITFCSDQCEMDWRDGRRAVRNFIQRPLYPQD